MAKELEGVIRIGAVNCQEDWNLCNQEGIPNYPSLVLYPGVNILIYFRKSICHQLLPTRRERVDCPLTLNDRHSLERFLSSLSEMPPFLISVGWGPLLKLEVCNPLSVSNRPSAAK